MVEHRPGHSLIPGQGTCPGFWARFPVGVGGWGRGEREEMQEAADQ